MMSGARMNPELALEEDARKLSMLKSERVGELIPLQQLHGEKSESQLEKESEARQKEVDCLTTLAEKVNTNGLFD